jgi:hypothetical protein
LGSLQAASGSASAPTHIAWRRTLLRMAGSSGG